MSRRIAAFVAPAAAVVALLTGTSTSTAATPTLKGKVGPGETITLTMGGKKVTKLKAGVKYRLVITDASDEHDFRLAGPRTSKVLTGVAFIGTKTVTLSFKKGTYRFFCAPHADDMLGGFSAT